MGKMDYCHNLVLGGTVSDNAHGVAQFLLSDSNENVAYLVIKTGPYHRIEANYYQGKLIFIVTPFPAEDYYPLGNCALMALSKNNKEPIYTTTAVNIVDNVYYPDGTHVNVTDSVGCYGTWRNVNAIEITIDGQKTSYKLSEIQQQQ